MRAFTELWDEITRERYGVEDEKLRRFRYGVQVNSLGLTEQQPENNVYRILIEMMAVVLSKNARARAVQLPAWNEAMGLPRPWDQQWSLRMQQIVAFETDLLENDDIFDGSVVITRKVEALKAQAREELRRIEAMGGAIAAIESGYMKSELVKSNTERLKAIETGDEVVVGVNGFTETEPSPLSSGDGKSILTVAEHVEMEQIERLKQWRKDRDSRAVKAALEALRSAAQEERNIMEPSIACAEAGVTTGEWGETLRQVFGQYRAPTGVGTVIVIDSKETEEVRQLVAALAARLARAPKLLIGKPGLDGHSNGAEQIAVRAGETGFEVIYEGIRLTPAEIVEAASAHGVDAVGLSILSGSHVQLVREVVRGLRAAGLDHVPVVVGGIIPEEDRHVLRQLGVTRVYTPKDFRVNAMLAEIAALIGERQGERAA
jgi:(2R)-ethylmalonyl-CoA mutase